MYHKNNNNVQLLLLYVYSQAITTGTVPNFIDVVLNFGNAALSIDSIIHQIITASKKIVFCGDDTWIKLFPNQFTRQLENRDSLFVNDFYEVSKLLCTHIFGSFNLFFFKGDKNITQRLNAELKHADWDLLILHYLGLDHIGHVEGPYIVQKFRVNYKKWIMRQCEFI